MKRKNQILPLITIFITLLFYSCSKDNDVIPTDTPATVDITDQKASAPYLNTDGSKIIFTGEGGTIQVRVYSNTTWSATAVSNVGDFFSISPASGNGDGIIYVTASYNNLHRRGGWIDIVSSAGTKKVYVEQTTQNIKGPLL